VKRYRIEKYKSLEEVTLYTIREEGKTNNETDDFILRFKDDPKFKQDVETITYYIQKIGERGALERNFRPEKRAVAIPISSSKLRLYGYRVNNSILILGNGGEKTSKKVQDSPDAFPHFELMNFVAYVFNLKLEKQEITIEKRDLKGDFSFFVK
jgi:hypothetical protein